MRIFNFSDGIRVRSVVSTPDMCHFAPRRVPYVNAIMTAGVGKMIATLNVVVSDKALIHPYLVSREVPVGITATGHPR